MLLGVVSRDPLRCLSKFHVDAINSDPKIWQLEPVKHFISCHSHLLWGWEVHKLILVLKDGISYTYNDITGGCPAYVVTLSRHSLKIVALEVGKG